jgi:alanine dehydrogenase
MRRSRRARRPAAAEADVRSRRAACPSRSARIIWKRNKAAAACCWAACPAWRPREVAILGGGIAGVNAAQMAVGMRADVTIYDINNDRLAELDMFFSSQIKTAYASKAAIAAAVKRRIS